MDSSPGNSRLHRPYGKASTQRAQWGRAVEARSDQPQTRGMVSASMDGHET